MHKMAYFQFCPLRRWGGKNGSLYDIKVLGKVALIATAPIPIFPQKEKEQQAQIAA